MKQEHQKLQAGTVFRSKSGETAEVFSYSHYSERNHYYECVSKETGELKTFQYSALRHGNWTFKSKIKYSDRELHRKCERLYNHIQERISKLKSYADVENEFGSVLELYQFFIHYFEENPQQYEPFITGELIIDKDLLSVISILEGYGKFKKYSPDTILLVTRRENVSDIPLAIRSKDLEKMKQLEKKIKQRQVI